MPLLVASPPSQCIRVDTLWLCVPSPALNRKRKAQISACCTALVYRSLTVYE